MLLVDNCFPRVTSALCGEEGAGEGANKLGARGFTEESAAKSEKMREAVNGDEL
jgi:hypothetical protein